MAVKVPSGFKATPRIHRVCNWYQTLGFEGPAGHGAHATVGEVLNSFCPHGVHPCAPEVIGKPVEVDGTTTLPAGQTIQLALPVPSAYWPSPQSWHAVVDSALYWPV